MKRLLALFLLAGLLIALGACKNNTGLENTPVSVDPGSQLEQDSNFPVSIGNIRIEKRPKAVVSLSPALTEILMELDVGDRLVGVSEHCDYPRQVQNLARCGTQLLPNLAEIKKLSPQVVFASSALSQEDTVRLQQMGAEVVVLPHANSLSELEELYIAAGSVLDGIPEGERNGQMIFGFLYERYEALTAAASTISKPVSGIYLRMTPLFMATGDTFEGELLSSIGIKNDAQDFTDWTYPSDKAAQLYPDVIFYDQSIDPQYLKDTKIYNTTDAVKQDRCYMVDGTAFERQSSRMFTQLEKMFQAVYPDVAVQGLPEAADGGESSLSGIVEEPK